MLHFPTDVTPPPRVLVLSHDPELRRELSITLRLWRLDPVVCRDPSELSLEASRGCPLAVVLDATMPGTDVVGLARSLREFPTTRGVVCVGVLDHLGEDAIELATKAGCDRVTARPVDPDWVGAEIERVAARRGVRAA